MLQVNAISLAYGDQIVFDRISFTVDARDRIGLVGRNGSGKTTLLKAIIDPTLLDDGSISIASKKSIAYMPQEVVLESELSIFEETFSAFSELYELQQEAKRLEMILESNNDPAIGARYAEIQERMHPWSPAALEAKTKKMLMGLGFAIEQLGVSVNTLSVGWKMRIVLAKLLLQEADFYLFDEPTNHLDLLAKEWFLDFLKQAPFGFILICHERYFLNELCDSILELERGKSYWYNGDYNHYEMQKERNRQTLEAAYLQQQKELKRKQETIERFRAGTKAKMAQSMERALERIERVELPPSPKTMQWDFPPVQQSGKTVVTVENVSHAFGNKTIFEHVSLCIERGHKVALIAPNGVGKTTLFNLIAGKIPVQKGTISFGYNVTHAIFAQDQNKVLVAQLSILENMKQLCPKASEQTIRSFLGMFLFSGNDILKKVGVLSGGEKNRVGMASVLLQQANLLLLDEPTNHLDIPSKEILLSALQKYSGTLIFVSHDRDFINELATDIIELTRNGVTHYQGNYDAYVYHKHHIEKSSKQHVHEKNKQEKIKHRDHEKRIPTENVFDAKKIKQLEQKIAKLEKQIAETSSVFDSLTYGTPEFNAAMTKLQALQRELSDTEKEWEQMSGHV